MLRLPLLVCLLSACAEADTPDPMRIGGFEYSEADAVRYKLPKVLREISGLTLGDDDHLYGHDDERGIVYRIDYRAGRVIACVRLGGARGKSGHRRAERWGNPRRRKPMESGTERRPPGLAPR